jgi:uncharacterized membrane protein YqjE
MFGLLPKLAPMLAHHLSAYVELAAADMTIAAGSLRRRLIAAVIGLVGAVFALLLACGWLLAATWETPWRNIVFGALLLLFVVAAAAGWVRATNKPLGAERPFARLRAEWEQDQRLIHELSSGEAEVLPMAAPERSAVHG